MNTWNEGFDANSNGVERQRNPYPDEGDFRRGWFLGWDDSHYYWGLSDDSDYDPDLDERRLV